MSIANPRRDPVWMMGTASPGRIGLGPFLFVVAEVALTVLVIRQLQTASAALFFGGLMLLSTTAVALFLYTLFYSVSRNTVTLWSKRKAGMAENRKRQRGCPANSAETRADRPLAVAEVVRTEGG